MHKIEDICRKLNADNLHSQPEMPLSGLEEEQNDETNRAQNGTEEVHPHGNEEQLGLQREQNSSIYRREQKLFMIFMIVPKKIKKILINLHIQTGSIQHERIQILIRNISITKRPQSYFMSDFAK